MNRFFSLLFILHLFTCRISYAQDSEKYIIQQFTTENGLPSNGIKGLQWDEQTGFLWIATEAGVSRYNGVDFTNFTKENTPGLSHERMTYIVKNRGGEIYTSDVGANTLMVKANSLQYSVFPDFEKIGSLNKRFFLSVHGVALRKKVFSYIEETKRVAWRSSLQLTDSSMVIAGSGRSFFTSPALTGFREFNVPPEYTNAFVLNGQLFYSDKLGRLYKTVNNFQSFEPVRIFRQDGGPFSISPKDFLLYWDNGMNNPILFSGNNAWLLHYRNGAFEASLICSSVPSYSYILYAQYSEKNKTLFIGTDSKGIIIISEKKLTPLKYYDSDFRERNAYYSQVELSDGSVLTNEGHVIGTTKPAIRELPITGKFDFSVYTEGDSILWFSQVTKEGASVALHSYNYRNRQTVVYDKVRTWSNFAMLFTGGRRYIATYLGFGVLNGDSLQPLFRPGKNKVEQAAPNAMLEFSKNVIGVASCDGLILYDLNKMSADTILKPFGYCIRSLWRYKDYIFIGTYGKGFYIWKNGQLKAMPVDKNKFLLYTHCFEPDTSGYCWISSNRGLFKAQLSDLIETYEKNKTQVYYHYFGKNDGMGITEMNGGCAPCALVLKNGTLSFPTMDGLLWVNPSMAKPLLPEGNIYLDEFIAGEKIINTDSLSITPLPSAARDIKIRLGFSAWCNKENIYLEYRLNDNSSWTPVDIKSGALISFNNLLPGKYNLVIRKLNGFGVNNYSYKEIEFTIKTPWHQRWWFYVACILLLTGITALYFNWRTRQYKIRQRKLEKQVAEKTKELQEQNEILEKNNSRKTRLISIISHDIVTPLKFLTAAGKNLLEKRKMMSEDLQQETVQEMTNTSQELQLLSTNILNWIKYQNENRRMVKEIFNLHEMVAQVLGILQTLARQKSLVIRNNIDPYIEINQFYEPLKILVYNLLTNAIQFTEKGIITVDAKMENSHITVSVKDSGIGMGPEQIQRLMEEEVVITAANVDNKKGHGLGYLIIKDLLKTMGAALDIASIKGTGTTVSIKMNK